ncbi:MAG: hypothetical protein J5915_11480 [Acidaminococcaceae bacterium]|nr:hypothetical protein [Acidaminococcaceae bacterium]MBQ5346119.1 hypothetical protein [Acidaminococcaceae bacterium]
MAKYLGGISDPDIDVVDISEVSFLDFEIEFFDKQNPNVLKKISVSDTLLNYKEITSEQFKDSYYNLTWGLAGYLAGGPLWAAIGAILGGGRNKKTVSSHVIACQLDNGWQFAVELDDSEFIKWEVYMER